MITANDFRQMALSIPDVMESAHMNHPDFRVGGMIFASLGAPDEEWAMVKLRPEEQGDYLEKGADAFRPCNGVWGVQGCTNVHLVSAKKGLVLAALKAAAGYIAEKAEQRKPRAKRT